MGDIHTLLKAGPAGLKRSKSRCGMRAGFMFTETAEGSEDFRLSRIDGGDGFMATRITQTCFHPPSPGICQNTHSLYHQNHLKVLFVVLFLTHARARADTGRVG